MNALGLSDAQLAERKLGLHAGDADPIMRGDYRTVYARFQPGHVPEDLSGEFRVQLGSLTEPFNLAWTMRETGRVVHYHTDNPLMAHIWLALTGRSSLPELVVCKRYPFMRCNLDGMTATPQGYGSVIDAKHVGRSGEAEILRYTPAGVWQAICAGTDWWGLSIICGNKWEPPVFQAVDPFYQAQMITRARECWGFIERGEEPPLIDPITVLPPKPQPRLREIVLPNDEDEIYAATVRQNNWLPGLMPHIMAIIGTDGAAKVNAINRAVMKDGVPEDVGKLIVGRYTRTRTKAGAVTQTVAKMEDDDGR